MASASPVSSKIGDSINAIGDINGSGSSSKAGPFEMPKQQSLRGMNKPKCFKCGNVARSRCPYQSCKSCCVKADNPCHIHVAKLGSTLPEKLPPPILPVVEPASNDVQSTGSSWRLNSLRQLSTNFANFLRSKKTLDKQDAVNINRWRFMKLRDHIQGNLEDENEAFERYMWNVNLLEETFSISEEGKSCNQPASEGSLSEDDYCNLVSDIKMKLRSDTQRNDKFREMIKGLINQKLNNLQVEEFTNDDGLEDDDDELDESRVIKKSKKILKERGEKYAEMNDLIDKLNKTRTEEDFRSCLDLKFNLMSQAEKGSDDTQNDMIISNSSEPKQTSVYIPPKLCKAVHVNQDTLTKVDEEFSSLSHIQEL